MLRITANVGLRDSVRDRTHDAGAASIVSAIGGPREVVGHARIVFSSWRFGSGRSMDAQCHCGAGPRRALGD